MGAKETDRRPRRENCSESPARILGQTEETRSRRCNGLSLFSLLSLSHSVSLVLAPIDRSLSIRHTAGRVRVGTRSFFLFFF